MMVNPADLLRWGDWRPLVGASRDPEIPHLPGLYRIRRIGRDDLDYIGQTGMGTMTLRNRLGMLLDLRRARAQSRSAFDKSGALVAVSLGLRSVIGLGHFDGWMHAVAQGRRGTGHRPLSAGTSDCGIMLRLAPQEIRRATKCKVGITVQIP
jgi:hypothetical protein